MSKLELGQDGQLYLIFPIIPITICGCISSLLYTRETSPVALVMIIITILIGLLVLLYNLGIFFVNNGSKHPRLGRFFMYHRN